MIIGIIIGVAYFAVAFAVARWTAVRRGAFGGNTDDDDAVAIVLGGAFWPLSTLYYIATAPPRPAKQQRLERRIKELEKELEL